MTRHQFASGVGLRIAVDVTVAPGMSMLVDGFMVWRDKRSKALSVNGPQIRFGAARKGRKTIATLSPDLARSIAAGLEERYGSQIQLDPRKFGLSIDELDPTLPSAIDILPVDDD